MFFFRDDKSQQLRSWQDMNLRQGFNQCCGEIGMVNMIDHFCDIQTMTERARRLHFSLLQCNECFATGTSFLELRYHKLRIHQGITCKMCAICKRAYEHGFCFNEHPCCANGFVSFDSSVVHMYGDGTNF